MSLATIANIGGIPGMDLAITAAVDLARAVQDIKVFRRQAEELGNRCTLLLLSYQNACKGNESTSDFTEAADEITAIIDKANRKSQAWAAMGRVKSLVHQSEIREGIDSLYKDVDTCAHRFNIATHAGLHRSNREMAQMRERDAADFRETLQRVLENVEGLREVVAQPGVQNIVQTIQEELQQPIDVPERRENLRQGLLQIYRQTKVLPTGNDLTGQVEKSSTHPVASGGDNDVYTGMWLGQFKVALKLYRALNRTPNARKRFEREVELWRELQHPHVCRLYGIARFEDVIYSVSSWMENGDALSYINGTVQVIDRMGLLMDVRSGMEYLHLRNIVHGDLRAVNILIDERGRACISDFGLSKVLEDVDRGSITSHHTEGAVRWHARELIAGENDQSSPISPATDVWSFGMLCLEIMTGERPYSHRRRDAEVIADLLSKRLPPRPTEQVVQTRGLTDHFWKMMLACWSWDPRCRPDMKSIRSTMQFAMAGMVTPGIQLSESPQPIIGSLPPSQPGSTIQERRSSPIHIYSDSARRPSNNGTIGINPIPSNSPPISGSTRPITSPNTKSSRTRAIGASNGGALDLDVFSTGVQPTPRSVHAMSSNGSLYPRSPTVSPTAPTVHYIAPSRSTTGSKQTQDEDDIFSFYDKINFGDPSDLESRLSLNTPGHQSSRGQLLPVRYDNFGFEQSDGENSGGSVSSSLPSSIGSPQFRARTPSSSSSMPVRPSALLNFEDLDVKSTVRRDRSGRLLYGTLPGLVDELLMHSQGYAEHQSYQDIFLTNYHLFNPEPEPLRDIVRLLLRQHTLTESNASILVEKRVAIRHEILGFLRKLLMEQYGNAIDLPVLEDLRVFLESITTPASFAASAKDLSSSVENLIQRRKQARLRSSTVASLGTRSIRQSEIEPDRLAFAMMLIEGNSYKRITPTDCVLYLKDQDSPTSISEARILNNKIVNWVKRAILRSDRMTDRGDTLRFFINTAFECRKLRNFSSMSAILAAINSPAIAGLKKTRECLKKETVVLETQTTLSEILNPGHNHQAYRNLLPSTRHHCVPWLAVHLKDLKNHLQKHEGEVIEGGRKLINFERYRTLSEKIADVLRYQEKHRDLGSGLINFEPLSYLEEKISNTSLDADAEATLEARSQELRTLEVGKTVRRVDELTRAGFLAD